MEEYYVTSREDDAEMDVEGEDRPIGGHGPTDGTMESGLSVCTTDEQEEQEKAANGAEANDTSNTLDQRSSGRSSGRVVKPRVVYLAELEPSHPSNRGSDERKQRKGSGQGPGQDQAVFGIQVSFESCTKKFSFC